MVGKNAHPTSNAFGVVGELANPPYGVSGKKDKTDKRLTCRFWLFVYGQWIWFTTRASLLKEIPKNQISKTNAINGSYYSTQRPHKV